MHRATIHMNAPNVLNGVFRLRECLGNFGFDVSPRLIWNIRSIAHSRVWNTTIATEARRRRAPAYRPQLIDDDKFRQVGIVAAVHC